MGFPLPLSLCLAAVALSAWLNIFLSIRWRKSIRLQETHSGLLLLYDVLQLGVLLYLTGGLENPFSFLFLVPVTISATSLTTALDHLAWRHGLWLRHLSGLQALSACRGCRASALELPEFYIAGMWAAIICGVVFSAIYARRIAEEARQMSAALSATEMVLAREQRLSALDGLAAAAAHELGTPLATIALVAKELKREIPKNGPYTEDIDLLISQTARCREILARLSNREAQTDEMYQRTKMLAMIEDLIEPLRGSEVVIAVTSSADGDEQGAGAGTRLPPQPGDRLWSRKPAGECRRFRRDPRRGRCQLGPNPGLDHGSATMGRAFMKTSSTGWAIPSSPPGQAMARVPTRPGATKAWGLGSSSPRPCLSGLAPRFRWPTGPRRTMAPSFMSSGRAT